MTWRVDESRERLGGPAPGRRSRAKRQVPSLHCRFERRRDESSQWAGAKMRRAVFCPRLLTRRPRCNAGGSNCCPSIFQSHARITAVLATRIRFARLVAPDFRHEVEYALERLVRASRQGEVIKPKTTPPVGDHLCSDGRNRAALFAILFSRERSRFFFLPCLSISPDGARSLFKPSKVSTTEERDKIALKPVSGKIVLIAFSTFSSCARNLRHRTSRRACRN